ncbi:hypothetical protein [Halocynthiibacter sp.]|uniref:hypothetical protein n=1 Tax=Halocynthiibacter sp. TaxID=1979210 RepID=UPI003C5CE407
MIQKLLILTASLISWGFGNIKRNLSEGRKQKRVGGSASKPPLSKGLLENYDYSISTREEINALVLKFDVPENPVTTTLTHGNRIDCLNRHNYRDKGKTDESWLVYGQRYEVIKRIHPNRSGLLQKGAVVTFLGYYVFPYDNGLRLYFEDADRREIYLEFEGNIPSDDQIQMWRSGMNAEYLKVLPDNPRSTELKTFGAVVSALKGTLDRESWRRVCDQAYNEGFAAGAEAARSNKN